MQCNRARDAHNQPTPALCQALGFEEPQGTLKGRQTGGGHPNPVSDKLGGPSSLARASQVGKTTNKGTEAGETLACSQTVGLGAGGGVIVGGTGTRHEVRAGLGAWAQSCGEGKPLDLQRGHRRDAAGPRIQPPLRQQECRGPEGRDSWGWGARLPSWDEETRGAVKFFPG